MRIVFRVVHKGPNSLEDYIDVEVELIERLVFSDGEMDEAFWLVVAPKTTTLDQRQPQGGAYMLRQIPVGGGIDFSQSKRVEEEHSQVGRKSPETTGKQSIASEGMKLTE